MIKTAEERLLDDHDVLPRTLIKDTETFFKRSDDLIEAIGSALANLSDHVFGDTKINKLGKTVGHDTVATRFFLKVSENESKHRGDNVGRRRRVHPIEDINHLQYRTHPSLLTWPTQGKPC